MRGSTPLEGAFRQPHLPACPIDRSNAVLVRPAGACASCDALSVAWCWGGIVWVVPAPISLRGLSQRFAGLNFEAASNRVASVGPRCGGYPGPLGWYSPGRVTP